MKPNQSTLALLCAAFLSISPSLRAQDVPPKPTRPEAKSDAKTADVGRLIEQLGAERAADRRAAEDSLREIGESARKPLEKAADDSDDPEIRWRARRILRGLDGDKPRLEKRGEDSGKELKPRTPTPEIDNQSPDSAFDARMREMMKRMEESFGPDFKGLQGFGDLEKQMEDLQRKMEEMQGRTFGGRSMPSPFQDLRGFSNGTKLQIGPDGVHVEVQEKSADGDTETKTYEAPDLESFRQKYPEVARQYFGDGSRLRWFGGGNGIALPRVFGRMQPLSPRSDNGVDPFVVPDPTITTPPAEGERLGVYVGVLDDSVRHYLDIEDGLGILVDRVEDGTLATALGLEPKDVVLRIGDHEIRDTADVRAALRPIHLGEKVKVEINRKGATRTLEADKDADAPAPKQLEKVKQKSAESDGEAQTKGKSGR